MREQIDDRTRVHEHVRQVCYYLADGAVVPGHRVRRDVVEGVICLAVVFGLVDLIVSRKSSA